MGDTDHLLSEADAAAFLSKSIQSLRLWRRTGKGPVFYKIGRTPKYNQHDLNAWMHAHRITPNA